MRFSYRQVRRGLNLLVAMALMACCAGVAKADRRETAAPRERTFLFTYSATVTGLSPGRTARIWLPVPPTNEDQTAEMVSKNLPGTPQVNRESKDANEILYVEGKADEQGKIPLSVTYRITRREVKGDRQKEAS